MFIYSPLDLPMPAAQQLAGGELFAILRPYAFMRPSGERIIIPPSGLGTYDEIIQSPIWVSDQGSIPMIFQNIIEKAGPNLPAFYMHDWLYASEMFDRATCDTILKEACVKDKDIIYDAVRLGGSDVWSKHDPVQVTAMQAYYKIFLSEVEQRWPELIK